MNPIGIESSVIKIKPLQKQGYYERLKRSAEIDPEAKAKLDKIRAKNSQAMRKSREQLVKLAEINPEAKKRLDEEKMIKLIRDREYRQRLKRSAEIDPETKEKLNTIRDRHTQLQRESREQLRKSAKIDPEAKEKLDALRQREYYLRRTRDTNQNNDLIESFAHMEENQEGDALKGNSSSLYLDNDYGLGFIEPMDTSIQQDDAFEEDELDNSELDNFLNILDQPLDVDVSSSKGGLRKYTTKKRSKTRKTRKTRKRSKTRKTIKSILKKKSRKH